MIKIAKKIVAYDVVELIQQQAKVKLSEVNSEISEKKGAQPEVLAGKLKNNSIRKSIVDFSIVTD